MGVNRQFIRERIQVADEYEKCSPHSNQKQKLKQYFSLIKMANI